MRKNKSYLFFVCFLIISSCTQTPQYSDAPPLISVEQLDRDYKSLISQEMREDCIACIKKMQKGPFSMEKQDDSSIIYYKYWVPYQMCEGIFFASGIRAGNDSLVLFRIKQFFYSPYFDSDGGRYFSKDSIPVWHKEDKEIIAINNFLSKHKLLSNRGLAKKTLTNLFSRGFFCELPLKVPCTSDDTYILVDQFSLLDLCYQKINKNSTKLNLFLDDVASLIVKENVLVFYDYDNMVLDIFEIDFNKNTILSKVSILGPRHVHLWL